MTPSIARLKAKSLIYLSGCGGILVFILLILILPYHYKLKRMDVEIENKKKYMEEQTLLIPYFQKIRQIKRNLKEIQEEARFNEPAGLPLPPDAKLPSDETEKALLRFKEIAQKNYFEVEAVEADSNGLDAFPGYMFITIKIKGNFLHFYNFLILLNQIPYVAHIEQIRIRTIRDAKEIYLKIWITIQ